MNVSENQPQNLRGLKALVGIMGVLIVIGTTVVVGTIIHRLYTKFLAPSTVQNAQGFAPPPPGPVAIPAPPAMATAPAQPFTLPKGTQIESIAPAGAGLAILTTSATGQTVLLLDPASGKTSLAVQSAP